MNFEFSILNKLQKNANKMKKRDEKLYKIRLKIGYVEKDCNKVCLTKLLQCPKLILKRNY